MSLIVRLIFLAVGLAAMVVGLLLTIFIDLPGLRSIWAQFVSYVPFGLALAIIALALGIVLLAQRDPVGWAVVALGLGAGVMLLAQMPFVQAPRTARAWQVTLDQAFGAGWQDTIPAEMRARFLASPVNPGLKALPEPAQPIREQELLYASPDGQSLPLIVYRPDDEATYPALISIHGGGWYSGGLHEAAQLNRYLAGQGYVVVDMTYRYTLRGEGAYHYYPEPMADVRCAIGFVKDRAAELGVDPGRVALIGRSVGGHMALLSAYAPADLVKPSCETSGDYSVKAVIAIYSPTDLEIWVKHGGGNVAFMVGNFLGDLNAPDIGELYAETAPLRYVNPAAPPTLLIDGARDIAVPSEHHDLLYAALREAGVTSALLRTPWSGHRFDVDRPAALDSQLATWAIERFLAWQLYGGGD